MLRDGVLVKGILGDSDNTGAGLINWGMGRERVEEEDVERWGFS